MSKSRDEMTKSLLDNEHPSAANSDLPEIELKKSTNYQNSVEPQIDVTEEKKIQVLINHLKTFLTEAKEFKKMIDEDLKDIKTYLALEKKEILTNLKDKSKDLWEIKQIPSEEFKQHVNLQMIEKILFDNIGGFLGINGGDLEALAKMAKKFNKLLMKDSPCRAFDVLSKTERLGRFFKILDNPPALLSKYLQKTNVINFILQQLPEEAQENFKELVKEAKAHIDNADNYCREICRIQTTVLDNLKFFIAAYHLAKGNTHILLTSGGVLLTQATTQSQLLVKNLLQENIKLSSDLLKKALGSPEIPPFPDNLSQGSAL